MRPLRLELQGFTCFRDFTVIDFSNLELFAIVGQTGAGKSSILDALTFALFEQTPRLGSKPAKELISQGSQGMSLALEFEASDGRKYRVARTYSSKSSEVRFERFEAEKWVTAVEQIKKKEVAEAIERVVGLDFEGFTRAVLLPQGEFDRFLRGEPKQRRDLLKNLIGLERIEMMQKRSGELAREAKTKSETMQTQLEALADATPDALEALELEQIAQQKALEESLAALGTVRQQLLEAREVHRIETSLGQVKLEIENLEKQNPQIDLAKERLSQARRVAGVLPLLENLLHLEARRQQTISQMTNAQKRLAVAQEEQQQAREALETARDAALDSGRLEALVLQLSSLQPRLERLQALGGRLARQANSQPFSEAAWSKLERLGAELPLLDRIAKALSELERRDKELNGAAKRLEDAQTALLEQQKNLAKLQKQQLEDSAQLKETRLAAAKIPALELTLRRLEALKPKLQRLFELGGDLALTEGGVVFSERAWSRLETVQSELRTHARLIKQQATQKTELELARDELLKWEGQLEESQTRLEGLKIEGKAAAAAQKALEMALEAAKRQNIAAELVRGLSLGDPCPVCQKPLTTLPDLSGSSVPNAQEALDAGLLEVSRLRDEYTRLKEARKNHEFNKTKADKDLTRTEQAMRETAAERQQLEQGWQDVLTDVDDPKSAVQMARAALLAGLASELAGATDLEARIAAILEEKTTLEAAEKKANQQENETRAQLARSQSATEAAQVLLESRFIEQENAQQEKIRLTEQRLGLVSERQDFVVKLEAQLGTSSNPEVALGQVQSALLAGLANELLEAGATNNLSGDIKTLKIQRQQLEQTERQATETFSNKKSATAGLQSAFAAAQQNLELVQQEAQSAQLKTQQQLEQLGFETSQAAQAVALPETKMQELEAGIQQHQQNLIQASRRQRELLHELDGRSLERPLLELEQQIKDLEVSSQSQRGYLGRLEAQKTQLVQHISQAKNLRREQNNFEKRFDVYAALATDLKGNEFQDYLLAGVQQQLLHRASKTMLGITRERYTLEFIDSEFHVRDAWNGLEARGVKTLSGGESFIASLSLALSLSDYLAGNQALGALFLDEGFGTLDADALEMVANTLENLQTQGRMVGVITHVPALAERLPVRLLIEKAQDTSRVSWDS